MIVEVYYCKGNKITIERPTRMPFVDYGFDYAFKVRIENEDDDETQYVNYSGYKHILKMIEDNA